MKDMIMKPKIWLVVLAVMHTLLGVIATYIIVGNPHNAIGIKAPGIFATGTPNILSFIIAEIMNQTIKGAHNTVANLA